MGGCVSTALKVGAETVAEGHIDLISFAINYFKNAVPYIVKYLGRQQRPKEVDMEATLTEAKESKGFQPWKISCQPKGAVRGLFIGVNYGNTEAQLSGCCHDIMMMIGALQKRNFPLTEVVILADEEDVPGRTGEPTRANILRYLAWLAQDAQPNDVLFFHYSGHGTRANARDDDCEEYDQCIVPMDYVENGCIVDNEIHEILVSQLPKGVRLTAVFDCSHSGSMLDLPYAYVCDSSKDGSGSCGMKRVREDNDVQADVLMISACADDEAALGVDNTQDFYESGKDSGGAATFCLTAMMMREEPLTFLDLLVHTREMLKSRGFTQVPHLSASKPINLMQRFSLEGLFPQERTLL
uniref:Inactive metacaspase-4 n=1 Tax=Trypanosoma brucei brucei TaxID=5702 RepID=MCA4_TRYBB|nr:RecName: Full=Inactive metacaspase-4; AltName: Full=TbMCA4 [Trypanosoma brucei brucei]CAD24805.1 metacaspase [Trypanosoma brucei]